MVDGLCAIFFWVSRSLLVFSSILFTSLANLAVLRGAKKLLSELAVLAEILSFSCLRFLLVAGIGRMYGWLVGWLAALLPAPSADPCRLGIEPYF